jgi:lycopene cyclase domain-containing protein
MTYTVLVAAGLAFAAAWDLLLLRTRLLGRRAFWTSWLIMVLFQLLTNGVLTGLGIVRYDPRAILGVRVAYAPIEDLGFGFVLILLTLSSWVWLGRRTGRGPGW